MRYLLSNPITGKIGSQNYKTAIHWRNGVLITDEPQKLGGQDLGPDPYTLLLSSLVGCTLATLKMYIDLKEMPVSEIEVEANIYYQIEDKITVAYIDRKILFRGLTDADIQDRLLRIAENCPISKILKGNIRISSGLYIESNTVPSIH